MIPVLVAVGLGFVASGCASLFENGDSTFVPSNTGKDGGPDDIPSTDSAGTDVDADAVSTTDTTSVQGTPVDSYINTAPSPCPSFPLKGNMKLLGTLPCGTEGGFISDIDADGNGTCTDFSQSWFFKFNANGITSQTVETKLLDQITASAGTLYFTAMDGQKGTYGVGAKTATGNEFKSFSATTISGKSFTPSFGKGVLAYGGKLFVTSSNISFTSGPPSYYPGTVMVYNNSDLSTKPTVLPTDGMNPTSIGVVQMHGKTLVAVVNTGDYNTLKNPTAPDNVSSLTLIDPETLTIQSGRSFGTQRGLGISGEISSAGTRLALGSGDNSGKVVVVDLESNTVQNIATANSQYETHLISVALLFPNGQTIVTGDYNTGALRQWDLAAGTPSEVGSPITLDKNLTDNAGISDAVCMSGKLYVAVGKDIWVVE